MEESLLRDEEDMLELYLKEGLGVIEDVLVWLPQSKFWFGKITSLAKLNADFDAVFRSYDKYQQKALDNGTEDGCEDFVREVFLASGGSAAEFLEWERLNPPPPIDPADAAEEKAMYAYDDEFGVDVFNPWAEADAANAQSSFGLLDAWAEVDANVAKAETAAKGEDESDDEMNTEGLEELIANDDEAAEEESWEERFDQVYGVAGIRIDDPFDEAEVS
jgi:hypothetical protein